MSFPRHQILARLRELIAKRIPIFGGGAGTGISAKFEEEGGIDLIVIYNSGRFRMAGRGSLAGMMPYGDANAIVMEMASEVLTVVKRTPVLAGVCGTSTGPAAWVRPRGPQRQPQPPGGGPTSQGRAQHSAAPERSPVGQHRHRREGVQPRGLQHDRRPRRRPRRHRANEVSAPLGAGNASAGSVDAPATFGCQERSTHLRNGQPGAAACRS